MKTTGEIIAILDETIKNECHTSLKEMLPYKEPELNSILVFGGAETAAFVHGYRVAEREYCAKVQELERTQRDSLFDAAKKLVSVVKTHMRKTGTFFAWVEPKEVEGCIAENEGRE